MHLPFRSPVCVGVIPLEIGDLVAHQFTECVHNVSAEERGDVLRPKFGNSIPVLGPVGVVAYSLVFSKSCNMCILSMNR